MSMFFVAETVAAPSVTVSLKCTVPGVAGASNVGVSVVGLLIVTCSGSSTGSSTPAPSTCVHWKRQRLRPGSPRSAGRLRCR